MRPFARGRAGRTHPEHALGHRVEEKKFTLRVSDDDGIPHVGQNRLEDFVGLSELVGRSFPLHHHIQLGCDRRNHFDQSLVRGAGFMHEEFDHRDDVIARQNGNSYSCP